MQFAILTYRYSKCKASDLFTENIPCSGPIKTNVDETNITSIVSETEVH